MGKYPFIFKDRPVPIYNFLKTRSTVVLKEPLAKKLNGEHSASSCVPCEAWARVLHWRKA